MNFTQNRIHQAIISATKAATLAGLIATGGLLTAGLTGCSSSTDGTAASASDITRIGRITGFGSVFVGGVEYESDTATITKDGRPAINGDNDLKVGMIVTVRGSTNGNQGVANSIEFTDELEGVVQGIPTINPDGTGSMKVMGHTVTLDTSTNFESDDPAISTPADIPDGAIVEVSGYNDGAGNILASYIELKAKDMATYGDDMEVKGVVSSLSDAVDALTFVLGKVTVDATAIRDSIDLGQPLANDLYVEVKSATGFDSVTGYLVASKIELEDDGDYAHDGEDGDEMEVEGIITATDMENGTIDVDGRSITLSEGMDLSSYVIGDLIEIKFRIDADGNAVADKIEKDDAHDDADEEEIKGFVTAIDTDSSTITIDGKTTISVDKFNAIMIDDSSTPDKYFSISSLSTGDRVEVDAYQDSDGNYIAIKVKREDD